MVAVTPLRIIKGDATSPQDKGRKVIAHVCNDLGGWGKGFVLAVSRRWPEPERDYREWRQLGPDRAAGGSRALRPGHPGHGLRPGLKRVSDVGGVRRHPAGQ
jgi:O-acetyl-ADP-ribose deacetylase (regulator of RNase III)